MGRGTKSHVEHFKPRDDGKKGCWICGEIATRWADFEHFGIKRWLSTAYCDDHGETELAGENTTERKMRKQV